MIKFIIISLILITLGNEEDDKYKKLIDIDIEESKCKEIIETFVEFIKQGYAYDDFLKAPIQPKIDDKYIPSVDLISELKQLSTSNRKYYDFYTDITKIIGKTRDIHFKFSSMDPKFILSRFCLPFEFEIKEEKINGIITPYLTIIKETYCLDEFDDETKAKLDKLYGKKIQRINDMTPIKFLDYYSEKLSFVHSPQARYIDIMNKISFLNLLTIQVKKEDLDELKIKFQDEDEIFAINHKFVNNFENKEPEFSNFYISTVENYLKNGIQIPNIKKIELDYNINKGIYLNEKNEGIQWDYVDELHSLKCKVDHNNKINILYQSSFMPSKVEEYAALMDKCFSMIYSNNYKLIIIERQNPGGYVELCYPFSVYAMPKVLKPLTVAMKSSQLNLQNLFENDELLDPITCKTYTEKDEILEGGTEEYSPGVIHKRTKIIEPLNIFQKKLMEEQRIKYLNTNKVKKPTDIIIFSDGYEISCASIFLKQIQSHGQGIIVGYNAKPNITKNEFDSSQSASTVDTYENSEYSMKLRSNLFYAQITNSEIFDPNEIGEHKIPYEFTLHPVDEISNIFIPYSDDIIDRFISEANIIFNKYNELGECNPDNKFLYYETSECDSKLNIQFAHGGYVCGSDGKWDKNHCIAAYCDRGYILNDERTLCVKEQCQNYELVKVSIKDKNDFSYEIEPDKVYIFTIENEKYNCTFDSSVDSLLFINNKESILEKINKENFFTFNEKIYVNHFMNITEKVEMKVSCQIIGKEDKEETTDQLTEGGQGKNQEETTDEEDSLHTGEILLIIVGVIVFILVVALIFLIVKFKIFKKKEEKTEDEIDKIEPLNQEDKK